MTIDVEPFSSFRPLAGVPVVLPSPCLFNPSHDWCLWLFTYKALLAREVDFWRGPWLEYGGVFINVKAGAWKRKVKRNVSYFDVPAVPGSSLCPDFYSSGLVQWQGRQTPAFSNCHTDLQAA